MSGLSARATGLLAAMILAAPSVSPAQTAAPESVGMSSKQLALIDDALRVNIAAGQIPGGIVLVKRQGKVVYAKAQGTADDKARTPLKTNTIFNIASLSKPITAVAIMMLVDEGKINVNDPVSKYIPEFGGAHQVRELKPGSPPAPFTPLPGVLPTQSEFGPPQYQMVPAQREITVRDLLTHTSGIQIFGVPNDPPAGSPPNAPTDTLAVRIPRQASLPLEFQPGSRWAYSNGAGFDVLGRVVEVASGQPFNVFLKQRLFDPLGMKDTGFGVQRGAEGRSLPLPFPGARIPFADETRLFSGAAGVWSTIEDYVHFVEMLANGGSVDGRQFLKPETVKAMASNQIGPLIMGGYPPMALPPEGVKFGYGMLNVTNPPAAGTRLPVGAFGWDGVGTRRFWAVPSEKLEILIWVPLIGPAAAPLQRDVEAIVMSSIEKK